MKPPEGKKEVFTRALKALSGSHVPYRILSFKARDRDAEEVSRETGFPLNRVIKTLLVKGDSGRYYLALCPGDRQMNLKALAKAVDEKGLEMAPREEVIKITGYFIGGVSPLGTRRPLPVIIESSLLSLPEIAVSAGQWGCQAVLKPEDLKSVLGGRGRVASFASP